MSEIRLYKVQNDRKTICKNLNPIVHITETFRIKEPTDLLNPVVVLSKSSVGENWPEVNYAYIPMFGRFYFVNDIRLLSNEMIELSLAIDVLWTYASGLKNTAFEIARSESLNSKLFVDPELYLQVKRTIDAKLVGSITQSSGSSAKKYCITVSGGTAS